MRVNVLQLFWAGLEAVAACSASQERDVEQGTKAISFQLQVKMGTGLATAGSPG